MEGRIQGLASLGRQDRAREYDVRLDVGTGVAAYIALALCLAPRCAAQDTPDAHRAVEDDTHSINAGMSLIEAFEVIEAVARERHDGQPTYLTR